MKDLRGKTALVTGASRGIGVHIARALAREGMNLVLAARSADDLSKVAEEVSIADTQTWCVPTDVGDRTSLQALVDRAIELGGVDVLVNNAGIEEGRPFHQAPPELIDQVIEVNLRAPMMLARLLLPQMIERGAGHIVNIASVAGLMGTPYSESYSASKHGIMGFNRSLRGTAVGEGYPVGVSAICPGFVTDSGMYDQIQKATGRGSPRIFGTSSPEKVAKEVVRAIVDDVPEIVVNPIPMRPTAITGILFPRFMEWFGRKSGIIELFRRVALARTDPDDEAA